MPELIYQSEFKGEEMDARFAAVAQLAAALEALTAVVAQKYVKPASGIPSTDMDADVQAALAKANTAVQSLADYYTKSEVDQLLAAINGMDYVDVATLPTASASTMGKIYLVGPDASGYYSYYYTSYDGSAYSWVGPLGTTQISLANYATKAELSQLDQKLLEQMLDNVIHGNNNTMVSRDIYGLRPGQRYRLYFAYPPDLTGVTATSGSIFVIYSKTSPTSSSTTIVNVPVNTEVAPYYDFILPADSRLIRVSLRATSGTDVRFIISELSPSYTETYSVQFNVVEGTQKTQDITLCAMKGEKIEVLLSGPDGVINSANKSAFFLDVTNNKYPPATYYNTPVQYELTGNSTKIRCIVGSSFVLTDGTVTFTVKILGYQEQIDGIWTTIDAIQSALQSVQASLDKLLVGTTYTKAVSLVSGTQKTQDFDYTFKKGQRIKVSITGTTGILTTDAKAYLYDVTNTLYYSTFAYNSTTEFTVQKNSSKMRFIIGGAAILQSGNVTLTIQIVATADQVSELQSAVETLGTIADGLDVATLPDYYFANSYIQGKVSRINTLAKDAVGNGDAFIFITDEHWTQNAKKSPNLLRYVADNTHIYNVFSGGDSGEGGSDDFCVRALAGWGRNIHHAAGNHDFNAGGTPSRLYYMFSMQNNNEEGEPQKQYYYVDNIQAKIRYIFLVSDGTNGYSDAQLAWFNAAMNVESGWGIIIITHYIVSMNWKTDDVSLPSTGNAANFVSALQNYSGNGEIIAVLQGHWHRDRIVTSLSNDFPVILTACDKYAVSTTTIDGTTVQDIDVTRTAGTISEQAFDVVIVNRTTKTINLVRIGGLARDGVNNSAGDEAEERTVTWGA